jgi:hypothetical protein
MGRAYETGARKKRVKLALEASVGSKKELIIEI